MVAHPTILVTGGCRSGKSGHAIVLGEQMAGGQKLFLATCVASDDEMRQRVRRHRQTRKTLWRTIEEPVFLSEVIERHGPMADVILIDCLTLWVSNLMMMFDDQNHIDKHIDALCDILNAPPCPLILVTNEVGAGIVPENPLARRFRDLTGWTNQKTASACRQVIWMVSGIPVTIKPQSAAPISGAS